MKTLSTGFRRQLERTVIEAREVAETGARVVLETLAVHQYEPYEHMGSEQRTLHARLRARARQLGDRLGTSPGAQTLDHLARECAFEHWHSMLFARFLAENHLLIEPEIDLAVSMDECKALAEEEGVDKWALAARFAHRMLPQVFRPEHPVFEVQFAQEHRLKLEDLVEGIPAEVFTATDSLGWVYQFWQSKKKDAVNRSEVKIGADELPAVTQLFTEPYMVQFLLQNSLGAWWASRYRNEPCPIDLGYLRRTEKGTPATGGFDGWPDDLAEFRLLDPCCGSGHFLITAFLMLVPIRMELSNLSVAKAVDAVLRDNLHGLELDRRCVAIAAFALALEAWRYPGAGGFRTLPKLNLAWCGQPVSEEREQWLALARGESRVEAGLAALFNTFRDAPTLGSLIDPTRSAPRDLVTAGFSEIQPLLEQALRERTAKEEWMETAIAALGLAEAARMLCREYHLIVTNVPYLGREKQSSRLRDFTEDYYSLSKYDLATVFVERLIRLCAQAGSVALVLPQYWLFLARYKRFRAKLLQHQRWRLLVTLGSGAFETISGEVVNTCLIVLDRGVIPNANGSFIWIDTSNSEANQSKAQLLRSQVGVSLLQEEQLSNPDSVIGYVSEGTHERLDRVAYCYQGLATSDNAQFVFNFWEVPRVRKGWELFQFAPRTTATVSGCSHILFWQGGRGKYAKHAAALKKEGRLGGWKSGHGAWGKRGVAINRMRKLPVSLYFGTKFDCNVGVLVPHDDRDLTAIWNYCSSPEYFRQVRKLNAKLSVTNATLAKVPFDSAKWKTSSNHQSVTSLYTVQTSDPTQWLFHGHPRGATSPLQVAVASLLGYQWPGTGNCELVFSDGARTWAEQSERLSKHADADGIVCIPSVRGESSASERIDQLLKTAWDTDWGEDVIRQLLTGTGCVSLDEWLRNQFFEEHCRLFRQRPFIWHIWDGRNRDGFHALVNYHKLAESNGKGRRLLEALAFSYLGSWISRQQDGVKRGESGAEDRLTAALTLQRRLTSILEGEPPFDLFVRWKPLGEQPMGWSPDLNDGVRLNIRPFMSDDIPSGKKGAGVLRLRPNIHWRKDRGREPFRSQNCFPWFWKNGKFLGHRVNDIHINRNERKHNNGKSTATDLRPSGSEV